MKTSKAKVKFQPQGRAVDVALGSTIREAASLAGIPVDYPCGGHGTCGKCRVRVLSDDGQANRTEREILTAEELADGIRLACQATIEGPTTVEVLDGQAEAATYRILAGASGDHVSPTDPPLRKVYVGLGQPTLEDDLADAERLCKAVGADAVDPTLLGGLPRKLRDAGFLGTAVLAKALLIDFETGDTTSECRAVAFDIGTTTLVGELIDLGSGRILAQTSRMNPQTAFGDDVLSRISHASRGAESLAEIHALIVGAVNEMTAEMAAHADVPTQSIYEATFAGNTTMQHLLMGFDPSSLGVMPFVPVTCRALDWPARDIGLTIHPRGRVFIQPTIGGFVGGDTVAGILAVGIDEITGPVLFVDIGTNGEIVLLNRGEMAAASCAAGPAFEGARISCGMRAATGAIEEIEIQDDVAISVIGDGRPTGLCGSALVDLAAELLRKGILTPQGLMLSPADLDPSMPEALRARVTLTDEGPSFTIADAEESGTGRTIMLTQKDVREMQLATAAVRAGISILLKRAGLGVADLDKLMIAGGFGNYIRLANAQRIGLLPEGLDEDRFEFVGNASLAGARVTAMSLGARTRADAIAGRTRHKDLSLDPDFQMDFAMAMFFPDEDGVVT